MPGEKIPLEEDIDNVGERMQNELRRLGLNVTYGPKDEGKNTLLEMADSMKIIPNGSVLQIMDCLSFTLKNLVFGDNGGNVTLRVIKQVIVFLLEE